MIEKEEGPPERTRETQREKRKDRRTERERQGERHIETQNAEREERERGKQDERKPSGLLQNPLWRPLFLFYHF